MRKHVRESVGYPMPRWRGAAATTMAAAVLSACSGGAAHHGPDSVSLPPAIAGYRASGYTAASGPTGTFGVFYGNPHFGGMKSATYHRGAGGDSVVPGPGAILVAAGRLRALPAVRALHEVYQMLAGVGGQGQAGAPNPFSAMHAVAPGPLGGQASCWTILGPQTAPIGSICTWMDSDTFGVLAMPGLSGDQVATTLLTFRSAIEKPSSGR